MNNAKLDNSSRLKVRWDIGLIIILSVAMFYIQALGWPLSAGRDFMSYVDYYVGLFSVQELQDRFMMLYRQPIAPIIICGVYQLGGLILLECFMCICFVASIVSMYFLGYRFNRTVGLVTAFWLIMFPGYGALYHSLASEPFFTCWFLVCLNFWVYTSKNTSVRNFAISGLFLVLLVLIRPNGQLFFLMGAMTFVLPGLSRREQIIRAGTFWAVSFALLSIWAGFHYVKYDDFTIARGSNAMIPFWRVYCIDRTVRPENGPASRALIDAIENDLLKRDVYKKYKITLEDIIDTPGEYKNAIVWFDLIQLSDDHWGWESDNKILKKVAIEAITAHPAPFLKQYLIDAFWMFSASWLPTSSSNIAVTHKHGSDAIKNYNRLGLPVPSQGRLIPYSGYRQSRLAVEASKELVERRTELGLDFNNLPSRESVSNIATFLGLISAMFPPGGFCAFLGIILLCIVKLPENEVEKWAVFSLIAISIAAVFVSVLLGRVAVYRAPFDALFILGFVLAIVRNGI